MSMTTNISKATSISKAIISKAKIYKVSHITNNKIKTIYVFIGKPQIEGKYKQLDKLFQKDPKKEVFSGIFTTEELDDITDNDIPVKFIYNSLHLDDTIEVIKKKNY